MAYGSSREVTEGCISFFRHLTFPTQFLSEKWNTFCYTFPTSRFSDISFFRQFFQFYKNYLHTYKPWTTRKSAVWTLGWFQKQLIRSRSMLEHFFRGQMKEFCSLISNLFLIFSWHLCVVTHFLSRFSKNRGTLWWKKFEKNRFWCLIPQKNRLEKCSLDVKLVFKNNDFWGSYGLKSTKK